MPVDHATKVPPKLQRTFASVWVVIRPRGTIGRQAEKRLRSALARRLIFLSSSGITEARELRRQAIEHFMLENQ
jgi:hypothetical protein